MSLEDYENLFRVQGGLCAICKRPEKECLTRTQHKLCVDHNHATGIIRGLLCHRCNVLVGAVEAYFKVKSEVDAYLLNDGAEHGIQ